MLLLDPQRDWEVMAMFQALFGFFVFPSSVGGFPFPRYMFALVLNGHGRWVYDYMVELSGAWCVKIATWMNVLECLSTLFFFFFFYDELKMISPTPFLHHFSSHCLICTPRYKWIFYVPIFFSINIFYTCPHN